MTKRRSSPLSSDDQGLPTGKRRHSDTSAEYVAEASHSGLSNKEYRHIAISGSGENYLGDTYNEIHIHVHLERNSLHSDQELIINPSAVRGGRSVIVATIADPRCDQPYRDQSFFGIDPYGLLRQNLLRSLRYEKKFDDIFAFSEASLQKVDYSWYFRSPGYRAWVQGMTTAYEMHVGDSKNSQRQLSLGGMTDDCMIEIVHDSVRRSRSIVLRRDYLKARVMLHVSLKHASDRTDKADVLLCYRVLIFQLLHSVPYLQNLFFEWRKKARKFDLTTEWTIVDLEGFLVKALTQTQEHIFYIFVVMHQLQCWSSVNHLLGFFELLSRHSQQKAFNNCRICITSNISWRLRRAVDHTLSHNPCADGENLAKNKMTTEDQTTVALSACQNLAQKHLDKLMDINHTWTALAANLIRRLAAVRAYKEMTYLCNQFDQEKAHASVPSRTKSIEHTREALQSFKDCIQRLFDELGTNPLTNTEFEYALELVPATVLVSLVAQAVGNIPKCGCPSLFGHFQGHPHEMLKEISEHWSDRLRTESKSD